MSEKFWKRLWISGFIILALTLVFGFCLGIAGMWVKGSILMVSGFALFMSFEIASWVHDYLVLKKAREDA